MSDALDELHRVICADDATGVRHVLATHPNLRPSINGPLPHGAFGETAILAAAKRRNLEMIDALRDAGADINGGSHWWAGSFGVLDDGDGVLADELIARGAVLTPHAAARLGRVDRLRAMLDADPQAVHARGGDGQLPLHFASTVEIAELLLSRGASIDAIDVDHESTAAQWMLGTVEGPSGRHTRHDIVRFLVGRGCRTDIMMAAALGDRALVERHLDANPDAIRTRVDARWFPMKDPRAGGTIYIWTLGAHMTPHLVAKRFGHDDVYAWLMARSPEPLRLAMACMAGDEEVMRGLVAALPDLARHLDEDDRRLIADAAESNRTDSVRLMLAAGWPADARGKHGATALHWAGFHGNVAMARELLSHAAPIDVHSAEFDGTPLDWALYGSREGWHRRTGDYPATVEALLAGGAKPPDGATASDTVLEVLRRYNRAR